MPATRPEEPDAPSTRAQRFAQLIATLLEFHRDDDRGMGVFEEDPVEDASEHHVQGLGWERPEIVVTLKSGRKLIVSVREEEE